MNDGVIPCYVHGRHSKDTLGQGKNNDNLDKVNMVLKLSFLTTSDSLTATFRKAAADSEFVSLDHFDGSRSAVSVGFYDDQTEEFQPQIFFYDKLGSGHFECLPISVGAGTVSDYDLAVETLNSMFRDNFGIVEQTDLDEMTLDTFKAALSDLNATYYGPDDQSIFLGIHGALKITKQLRDLLTRESKPLCYAVFRDVLYVPQPVNVTREPISWEALTKLLNDSGLDVWDTKCAAAIVF
jgi:hypothetical protein